jgi:hypothetical protein
MTITLRLIGAFKGVIEMKRKHKKAWEINNLKIGGLNIFFKRLLE